MHIKTYITARAGSIKNGRRIVRCPQCCKCGAYDYRELEGGGYNNLIIHTKTEDLVLSSCVWDSTKTLTRYERSNSV